MKGSIKLALATGCLALMMQAAYGQMSQTSPEEIRRLLGASVDIVPAAAFAATVASYRDNCGGPPEFDGHAEIIMRLEFGSLGAAGQDTYKSAMLRQYESNRSIMGSLGDDAKKDFCRGLNSAVLRYASDFVKAHPTLVEKKDPPPKPERKTFQQETEERLSGLAPFETLYVVRVAENAAIADVRKLFANPDNEKDGYLWATKVLAGDFALLEEIAKPHFEEIAEVYHERAEIYARYIRGQSDIETMKREEKANEKRKNDLYQARLKAYERTENTPDKSRVARLGEIAKGVGNMVIGQSKIMATEPPKKD